MLSPLRNRFGIPGVISVIALVFAMFGGAYAANNSSSDESKASASAKKGKKGPRGPRGPKGPAGPAGAQGPAGPQGPAGAQGPAGEPGAPGAAGKEGSQGKEGKEGKSIANTTEPTDTGNCAGEGGTKLVGTSTTYACNGKAGDPWAAGGTLPPNATETGGWTFLSDAQTIQVDVDGVKEAVTFAPDRAEVPISFSIPLAAALDKADVHVILKNGKEQKANFETFELEEVEPTACGSALSPAGTVANPRAQSGHLCVYVGNLSAGVGVGEFGIGINPIQILTSGSAEAGASTAGARLIFTSIPPNGTGVGTWAVTG